MVRHKTALVRIPLLQVRRIGRIQAVGDRDLDHDLVVVRKLTGHDRLLRQHAVQFRPEVRLRRFADRERVGIALVGRDVGRAGDTDVILVRDGEFVFAVRPDGRLEKFACLVVLPDDQARALHRHVERVGVNGEDLVVILVSGAGDQAAVSAARQHGRLVDGVVAGRERRDGFRAGVIEVVHAGRPVPDEVDAVGRLLGAGDDELVLVERTVLVVIDAVQREESVLAPAAEGGIRLVALHELLVGRDQGLEQIDRDLRVRIVGGHHDGVALLARLHERHGEVCGIVDVEPGERHPVPGERAQVVGVPDLASFVVVRVVGEGEGAVRVHDVIGAVVCHP